GVVGQSLRHAPPRRLRSGDAPADAPHTAQRHPPRLTDQIAHYKIPRYVKFVDGFPMTATGKIQKFLMRRQMIDELGLSLQKIA
ncbi:MAG TPA: hypothetical protein VJX94_08170, partial [Stellaceae bacterium]|nr:hypothetical protein [Stellaceae bacterium]